MSLAERIHFLQNMFQMTAIALAKSVEYCYIIKEWFFLLIIFH